METASSKSVRASVICFAERLNSDTTGSSAPGRCLWCLDRLLLFRRSDNLPRNVGKDSTHLLGPKIPPAIGEGECVMPKPACLCGIPPPAFGFFGSIFSERQLLKLEKPGRTVACVIPLESPLLATLPWRFGVVAARHDDLCRSFEVSHAGERQLPGVGCDDWIGSSS